MTQKAKSFRQFIFPSGTTIRAVLLEELLRVTTFLRAGTCIDLFVVFTSHRVASDKYSRTPQFDRWTKRRNWIPYVIAHCISITGTYTNKKKKQSSWLKTKKIGKTTSREDTIQYPLATLSRMVATLSSESLAGGTSLLYGSQRTPSEHRFYNLDPKIRSSPDLKVEPPCRFKGRKVCSQIHRDCNRRDQVASETDHLIYSSRRPFSVKSEPSPLPLSHTPRPVACCLLP